MRMNKLVKLLTAITVVKPGDTIMLATPYIRTKDDFEKLEQILKLKEWSTKTGIKYVVMPADITISVIRKEG